MAVVVVTGASSGIGRATALALAERGDDLVLVARRADLLEQVAEECRAAGAGKVVVAPADVGSAKEVAAAFDAAPVPEETGLGTGSGAGPEPAGRVDAVVHAAAVAAYGRFADIPDEVFDRVVRTNLVGTVNVVREAFRRFGERGGQVVVLGSIAGRISTPFMSPYGVTKWAVHGLVRTLQAEERGGPVSISLVSPGGVDTSIYAKAASVLGVTGRPPPPVATTDRVARAVVEALGRPRRDHSIGALNPVVAAGFRVVPGLYDALAVPLMRRVALGRKPLPATSGNLWEPLPEPETDRRPYDEESRSMTDMDTTYVVEHHANTTPDRVWAVLANGWMYPSWVVGASRIRAVEGDWPEEGARLQHSVGLWPMLLDDRTESLECDPPRRLRLKAYGWPAGAAEIVIELEAEGAGTRIKIREDAVSGPAAALPKPLRQMVVVRRNREALRRLAFLSERRGEA